VRVVACALAAAILGGCQGQTERAPGDDNSITFTRDVAPVIFRNCAACHRPGESAPFSLLTYDEVRARARTIVTAIERRIMPPWLPDAGFGAFEGERRLTSGEIDTISRWVEQGAPEGRASDLPEPPAFASGWRLGVPDLIVTLPRPYVVAAEGSEIWRNFVVPVPVKARTYVRAVEIRPGGSRVVHHALLGIDPTRASRRRDELDGEPGFEGMDMGDSQSPDGHLLGWTPGMAPFPGIKDRAWTLEPGSDLVLQVHLTPTGKRESVDPAVGFYFGTPPPSDAQPLQLFRLDADDSIDIAPGDSSFVVSDMFAVPVELSVLAVYPHAHFLATTMEAFATVPGGGRQWLIRIGAWDFKWQDIYRYTTPVRLPAGSVITMRYTYDNSSGNVRNPSRPPKRVLAGLRSTDEMAHLQLQVQTKSTRDALTLKEMVNRHALGKNPGNAWAWYELGNALRELGRTSDAASAFRAALARDSGHAAAHNNLGSLLADEGEPLEAIRHYRDALRAEPDFADAHFNLGNALRSLDRLAEAREQFRVVLRLEPANAEAHNNLGEVLSAEGHFDEALTHFQEAVRIRPGSPEAQSNLGAAFGRQGRYREAIDHFRAALQIDPSHARARDNLSIALERLDAIERRKQ
jgi:Tfp pilus assembly protein PilF/mono/diheme cytochrome c family protein